MPSRPLWHWVLAAGLLCWVGVGLIQWLTAAPLGHDESQYALAATDFLHGDAPRWQNVSAGMNIVALPGVLLGGGEIGLRALPFILGIGFIMAVWLLARATFGAETAAWAVAALAGCRSLVQRSTDLLSDIPASACLLAAMWLMTSELSREAGARWRLVLVAPLFAAAFYVRYPSVIPIAVITIAACVVFWRAILARWQVVAATALLLAALVLWHVQQAVAQTGSPLGLMLAYNSVVGGNHGDALVTYLTQRDPFKYYGLLAPPLMVIAILSIVRVRRDRPALFVWLVGIGTFVGMGMLTLGQPRYVFVSTTLFVMLGIDTVRVYAAGKSHRTRVAIVAVAACAVLAAWVSVTRKAILYAPVLQSQLATTLRASEAIRRDARGQRCSVVGPNSTQLGWYSRCTIEPEVFPDAVARGEIVYVVRLAGEPDGFEPVARSTVVATDPTMRVIRIN